MDDLKIDKLEPTDVFFSYGDNQLTYSQSQIASYINYHSITNNRLIITDSLLLCNRTLEKLLLDKHSEYYKLFENGIIVPALRNNVNSFEELFNLQNKVNARDRCINVDYSKKLDNITSKIVEYDVEVVSKNYTIGTMKLLDNYHYLHKYDLVQYSHDLSESIEHIVEENGILTRSDMWSLSDKYVQIKEKIKKLGTTLYISNIPRTYAINPVFPKQFSEYFKDAYITPYCGVPKKSLNPKIEMEEHKVIRIPDFTALTPASINVIREMEEFQHFMKSKNDASKNNSDSSSAYYSYLNQLQLSYAAAALKPEELRKINMEIKTQEKTYASGEKVIKLIGFLPSPVAPYLTEALNLVLTVGGNKMKQSLIAERDKLYTDSWLMLTQANIGEK